MRLTENLSLKLFSLAVSVLLFLFVSIESATPVDVDFRLEYRTADDIMIVGEAPNVVHTTLRGPWATFRSYDAGDLKPVVIDLTTAGPGTLRHAVDTGDISPPGGMSVIAVRPSEIQLTLDRKVERRVPVQIDYLNQPATGFQKDGDAKVPESVRVIGPAREVQALDVVFSRPVNLAGHRQDFTTDVELKPPPPPVRLRDTKVSVTVHVSEEIVTRAFADVPVVVDGAPAGTRALPDKVPVRLKGPRLLVEALDPKHLEAYVDAQPEYDEGLAQYDKVLALRGVPERTQWIDAPAHVQVQIPKGKVKKPVKRK